MNEAPRTSNLAPELRSEVAAGGFTIVDGSVEFYSRVQALLPRGGTVVDFGAGRGKWMEDTCAWRRKLADLRGEQRFVVGVDIDSALAENSGVDAAVIIGPDGALPFKSGTVGLLVADWVFEHLADPAALGSEFTRVLSPGGWLCARTPNRWGYIAIGARLIPKKLHVRFLSGLQPQRFEQDIFPTWYRLNTRTAIHQLFPREFWMNCTHGYNPDADYVGRCFCAYRALTAWHRLAPASLSTTLHVFLQRRNSASSQGGL